MGTNMCKKNWAAQRINKFHLNFSLFSKVHLLGLEIPGTGTGCDIAWRLANVVVNICPLEATNWTIWFPANWDTGIVITCCVATPSRKNINNWNRYLIAK